MNIKEAESFFKKYNGHFFHMFREEPSRYEEYQRAGIGSQVEEQWRQEMLQAYFESFWSKTDEVWINHGRIIEMIFGTKTKVEDNCNILLDMMEQMAWLDKRQKILIIEKMAGRTQPQEDGGCYLICTHTSLGNKMNSIMKKLMDFECDSEDNLDGRGWADMKERYIRAVSAYQSAYRKFGK